ncbi:MAG: 50S ribosomal protein L25/general stress protein Ctc [Alphaproteobacteria bacterium]
MTQISYSFKAENRAHNGKQLAKKTRNSGNVPAIVYGGGENPISLSLTKIDVDKLYFGGNFKSKIVEIENSGKKFRALAREVQTHPVSDKPIHIDFQRVSSGHDMKVSIPINVINVDKAPGIKRGGTLNVVRRYVEFMCDPDHIPEQILVDLTGLEISHSIHIKSIQLPKGVKPTLKDNFTLVTIVGRSAKDDAESLLATAQPETQVKSDEEVAQAKAAEKGGDKAGADKAKAAPAKAAPAKAAEKPKADKK